MCFLLNVFLFQVDIKLYENGFLTEKNEKLATDIRQCEAYRPLKVSSQEKIPIELQKQWKHEDEHLMKDNRRGLPYTRH